MSQMSDYLESTLLGHLFRTATFAKPTVVAIALCTAAPNDASTGATITEVPNSGSYARVTVNPLDANWAAVGAGGLTSNVAAITFPTATGSWGTVTHVAICDSATWGAGNMWLYGTLAASKTVNSGDTFSFAISALTVTFQ
jgi:hypothetical protein